MFQIKQLILARLKNIFELKALIANRKSEKINSLKNDHFQKKYQIMMKHKSMEEFVGYREAEILAELNLFNLNNEEDLNEAYYNILEIIVKYDLKFVKFREKAKYKITKELLFETLEEFFHKHDFQKKIRKVRLYFEKDLFFITPGLIFGWISQWSKKKYHQTLQSLKLMEKDERIRGSMSYQNKIVKEKLQSSVRIERVEKQLNRQITQSVNIHEAENESLILIGRTNIYCYLVEDLQQYYELTGISDVDCEFLIDLRKRKNKKKLLQRENIHKVIDILMESNQNKKINNNIKEYYKLFTKKFQKPNKSKSQPKPKKVFPIKNEKIYRKAHKKSITEAAIKVSVNRNVLESKLILPDLPKVSQINEKKSQFQEKLDKIKVLKTKRLMKLPQIGLSKSNQKQSNNNQAVINFSINMESQQIPFQFHSHYYPMSVRQSQKNIAAKKIYSQRKTHNDESMEKLKVEGKYEERGERQAYYNNEIGEFKSRSNLHTIREKSRALIKNYHVVKRYE